MQLVTYRRDIVSAAALGVVVDRLVIDVQALGIRHRLDFPSDMQSFIEQGATCLCHLRELIQDSTNCPATSVWPLSDVRLLAPIPRPRKNIFGIGLNYRPHIEESARSLDTRNELPERPVIFSKPPTAVIGPNESIHHDAKLTQQLDWEVELAVVIGRTAKRVPVEQALEHVFGYSIIIDISARDNRRAGQWIYSKGMDTYAPMGPCIVTSDEIGDPQSLGLWLKKNGELKQESNTCYMIFDVATLISDISQGMTLEPGDIIATGTPSGVGAGRNPPEWLWPGDTLEAGIDRIGTIRHPIVAA